MFHWTVSSFNLSQLVRVSQDIAHLSFCVDISDVPDPQPSNHSIKRAIVPYHSLHSTSDRFDGIVPTLGSINRRIPSTLLTSHTVYKEY